MAMRLSSLDNRLAAQPGVLTGWLKKVVTSEIFAGATLAAIIGAAFLFRGIV
jgi:hypothetical protein